MRILHFMNSPFSVRQFVSGGEGLRSAGGWLTVLIEHLLKYTKHNFACCSLGNADAHDISEDGRLECFVIRRGKRGESDSRLLSKCLHTVNEWKADLVHVHGTEEVYGLLGARGIASCPSVVSIQGLLGPSAEWYRYFGNHSLSELASMNRWMEILLNRGVFRGYRRCKKGAIREREIISGNDFFIGRTDWDRAFVRAQNPKAVYCHVDEPLRGSFWKAKWDIKRMQRHRIIFTNAGHPRKGAGLLLEALRILIRDYPGIQLCIAGNISRRSGYGMYLRKKMMEFGSRVIDMGPLDGNQMAEALCESHVFAHPSFIDNSPNSLAEAQLLGMPVVATYTGGVTSLVRDQETGLFCPTGDAPMLADRIRRIFDHDDLASRLGKNASQEAMARHNPETIIRSLVSAYEQVKHRAVSREGVA